MPGIKLLTANEVAEILKMNRQVILRKLQSGEIEGYKLDKDWRIKESALASWLESHSNRRSTTERTKVIESFFDSEGRLISIPTKRSKRLHVLERILEEFEPERVYAEKEVNDVIRRFHHDVCTLRREFIINKMMVRKAGCYRKRSSHRASRSPAPSVEAPARPRRKRDPEQDAGGGRTS